MAAQKINTDGSIDANIINDAITVDGEDKSLYSTAALSSSGVIKSSPGKLHGIIGINAKASSQYIQIFNATAVPSDNAVPKVAIVVPPAQNFSIDFGFHGIKFTTGVCWSNSTTLATKTLGSDDVWLTAIYE